MTSNISQSYPYSSEARGRARRRRRGAAIAAHAGLDATIAGEAIAARPRRRAGGRTTTAAAAGRSTWPAMRATGTPSTWSATAAGRPPSAERRRPRPTDHDGDRRPSGEPDPAVLRAARRRLLVDMLGIVASVGRVRRRLRAHRPGERLLPDRGRGVLPGRLRGGIAVRRRRHGRGGLRLAGDRGPDRARQRPAHPLRRRAGALAARPPAARAGAHGPRPDRRGVRAQPRPLPPARVRGPARLLAGRRSAASSSRGTSPRWSACLGGQVVPDPRVLGLDIVFPAAMAGLAVGLATGRREIVARRGRGRHRPCRRAGGRSARRRPGRRLRGPGRRPAGPAPRPGRARSRTSCRRTPVPSAGPAARTTGSPRDGAGA